MESGLNKYLFEMANIRNHCSWVHSNDWDAATDKAIKLVRSSVAKARGLEALSEEEFSVYPATLIIGGGVAGLTAGVDLAEEGFEVFLVEKSPTIGGKMAMLDRTFPTDDCSI